MLTGSSKNLEPVLEHYQQGPANVKAVGHVLHRIQDINQRFAHSALARAKDQARYGEILSSSSTSLGEICSSSTGSSSAIGR